MTTRDFTKDRSKAPSFTIGDNVYTAVVGMPAQTMLDFAGAFGDMSQSTPVDEQLKVFTEILGSLLEDDSYRVFLDSMASKHPRNMVDFEQVQEVIEWLLGEFGMRPTQLSSLSATGPDGPEPGTNLTGSTPVVELI